jgi:predicted fused transcriptional regulator/phosphomethylpyrimidine kinase
MRRTSEVPDLVFDRGGVGKEPMIRILGTDPQDVLRKLFLLL